MEVGKDTESRRVEGERERDGHHMEREGERVRMMSPLIVVQINSTLLCTSLPKIAKVFNRTCSMSSRFESSTSSRNSFEHVCGRSVLAFAERAL